MRKSWDVERICCAGSIGRYTSGAVRRIAEIHMLPDGKWSQGGTIGWALEEWGRMLQVQGCRDRGGADVFWENWRLRNGYDEVCLEKVGRSENDGSHH